MAVIAVAVAVMALAAAGCGTSGGSESTSMSTTTAISDTENSTTAAETTVTADDATGITDQPAPTTAPSAPGGAVVPMPKGETFDMAIGTADIDGSTAPTTQARVRPGGSGEVTVPVGTVLDIVVPGPTGWELSEDPDPKVFDLIDIDTIPDGRDDPFPEPGGATIVTVRPLSSGQTTLMLQAISGSGEKVMVDVTAH